MIYIKDETLTSMVDIKSIKKTFAESACICEILTNRDNYKFVFKDRVFLHKFISKVEESLRIEPKTNINEIYHEIKSIEEQEQEKVDKYLNFLNRIMFSYPKTTQKKFDFDGYDIYKIFEFDSFYNYDKEVIKNTVFKTMNSENFNVSKDVFTDDLSDFKKIKISLFLTHDSIKEYIIDKDIGSLYNCIKDFEISSQDLNLKLRISFLIRINKTNKWVYSLEYDFFEESEREDFIFFWELFKKSIY